jgi:hypothetical protein
MLGMPELRRQRQEHLKFEARLGLHSETLSQKVIMKLAHQEVM